MCTWKKCGHLHLCMYICMYVCMPHLLNGHKINQSKTYELFTTATLVAMMKLDNNSFNILSHTLVTFWSFEDFTFLSSRESEIDLIYAGRTFIDCKYEECNWAWTACIFYPSLCQIPSWVDRILKISFVSQRYCTIRIIRESQNYTSVKWTLNFFFNHDCISQATITSASITNRF